MGGCFGLFNKKGRSYQSSGSSGKLMAWNVLEPFGSLEDLTEDDCSRIKKQMSVIQDLHLTSFGKSFLQKLFSRYPDIKTVFMKTNDIDSPFGFHDIARRIMFSICDMAMMCDNPDVCMTMIQRIKAVHRHIDGITVDRLVHFFELLDEEFIRIVGNNLDAEDLDAVRKLWRILFEELTEDLLTDEERSAKLYESFKRPTLFRRSVMSIDKRHSTMLKGSSLHSAESAKGQ